MSAATPTQTFADMTVVVMAGGTGGHVFPALSVAQLLREGGAKLSWLGTARGIEAELVPKAGIPLHCLSIEGVRGRGVLTLLKAPFLLLAAVWQARKILQREGATVVLGLGGFASGPGGLAARSLGIPLVIHEQNAVAGTTNRWLARVASQCLEAFPGALPGAVHVGNPVRPEIAEPSSPVLADAGAERRPRILVLGGSLGALALNQMVPQGAALIETAARPEILHQCGKRHLQAALAAYAEAGVDAEVTTFIEDMGSAYAWADLVICRAGALTVSELTMAGKAALLVPYPHAIDDHQARNAQWLVSNEAGWMCRQEQLTPETLKQMMMQANTETTNNMGKRAKSLAMPEAAERVAQFCLQAHRGKQNQCSKQAHGGGARG